MMDGLQIFFSVIAVILILLAAYWCSRYLGRHWRGASSGRYIQVIDTLSVAQDRQLLVVQVRDENGEKQNILVGSSPQGFQKITDLEGVYSEAQHTGGRRSSGTRRTGSRFTSSGRYGGYCDGESETRPHMPSFQDYLENFKKTLRHEMPSPHPVSHGHFPTHSEQPDDRTGRTSQPGDNIGQFGQESEKRGESSASGTEKENTDSGGMDQDQKGQNE